MGVANQCATKIGSLFVFSKGMFFFFRLIRKRKNQKERIKAAFFQLLRCFLRLKGRNSLRSNSLPFLTPKKTPALDAEKNEAGRPCGVGGVAWHVLWAAWGLIVRLSLAGILRWFAREHLSEVLSYPCLGGRG